MVPWAPETEQQSSSFGILPSMLISHSHRFIFIKTVKTAGTSVEAFLEPYCCPPGHQVQHWTPTLISDYGVVGRRWPQNDCDDFGYYNHMSAAEIRERFADFDGYTRITTVRDPYDRAVSAFHYAHETWRPEGGIPLEQAIALVASGQGDQLQQLFVYFLEQGLADDQAMLTIDDELVVDHWIRYESLVPDLERLVTALALPLQGSVQDHLPQFKRNRLGRTDVPPVHAYLSPRALELIHASSKLSFSCFGYRQLNHATIGE